MTVICKACFVYVFVLNDRMSSSLLCCELEKFLQHESTIPMKLGIGLKMQFLLVW